MSETREEEVLDLLKEITKVSGLTFDEEVIEKEISLNNAGFIAVGRRVYNREKTHRYYLYIDIRDKKTLMPIKEDEILTVIMLNPSESKDNVKSKSFVDPTVTNAIKIAKCAKIDGADANFSAVEVLNLFSFIDPKPEDVKTNCNENNNDFIIGFVKKFKNPIMLAWGSNKPSIMQDNKAYVEEIKTEIRNSKRRIFVFRLNTKCKTPTHPSPRCRKYVRDFLENPRLTQIWEESE